MCFMCFYVFLLCASWMNIVWRGARWCQLDLGLLQSTCDMILHKFLAMGPGPNELESPNSFYRIQLCYKTHNSSLKTGFTSSCAEHVFLYMCRMALSWSLCNGSSVGGMARLRLWLCPSVLLPSSSDFPLLVLPCQTTHTGPPDSHFWTIACTTLVLAAVIGLKMVQKHPKGLSATASSSHRNLCWMDIFNLYAQSLYIKKVSK